MLDIATSDRDKKSSLKIFKWFFILFIGIMTSGCVSLFMTREQRDYQSSMTKALAEDWEKKTGGLLARNVEHADPKEFDQSACTKDCDFEDFTLLNLHCADCGTIVAQYCPSENRYWISSSGGMAFHVESYGPFSFKPTQKMLDYQAEKAAEKNSEKNRWWYPYLKKSKCN